MIETVLPLASLLALLAIGTPVGFAMAGAGMLGIWMLTDFHIVENLARTGPHSSTLHFTLTALPMFVLMAEFLGSGTVATNLFSAARAWFGRLPGGLAVASVVAGAGMGAISGSSLASTASLTRICVPEMRKSGYQDLLSLPAVACAGTLAAMIPPSVMLLMYGITTETSIGDLFAAGILPGILIAAMFAVTILVWQRLNPEVAPKGEPYTWRERFASLTSTAPAILLVLLVIGGMYSGLMTATEAGALGAFGGLIVSVLMGGLRWEGIRDSMRKTVQVTAAVFVIIIGAKLFSQFLTLSGVVRAMAEAIEASNVPPIIVLVLIFAIYAVLGAFMDGLGMMLLTLPVFFPLIVDLGYDPVWFGVMVVLVIELGLITPPIGINVFVAAGNSGGDVGVAFRGATRFYSAVLTSAVILTAFPAIATYLPSIRH
jgi:C4-dicarboxylate transporter DctM subunit